MGVNFSRNDAQDEFDGHLVIGVGRSGWVIDRDHVADAHCCGRYHPYVGTRFPRLGEGLDPLAQIQASLKLATQYQRR